MLFLVLFRPIQTDGEERRGVYVFVGHIRAAFLSGQAHTHSQIRSRCPLQHRWCVGICYVHTESAAAAVRPRISSTGLYNTLGVRHTFAIEMNTNSVLEQALTAQRTAVVPFLPIWCLFNFLLYAVGTHSTPRIVAFFHYCCATIRHRIRCSCIFSVPILCRHTQSHAHKRAAPIHDSIDLWWMRISVS